MCPTQPTHVAVYVDCRAAFPNLDRVTERLVHSTAKLVMRTYKIVKVELYSIAYIDFVRRGVGCMCVFF